MVFADLGTATALKERLRSIQAPADDPLEAEWLFAQWCGVADVSAIPEVETMARTSRTHIEGILAYWTNGRVRSAAMAGFNNRIRWLTRQAYGHRDEEYFKLKMYGPAQSTSHEGSMKPLQPMVRKRPSPICARGATSLCGTAMPAI